MSTSAAKYAANQANATLSTGPVDTSRTRFNGLTHGLTSKQTVIPGEDQEEYNIFERDLLKHFAPASPVESALAARLVAAAWRLKRFTRVETAFFTNRIEAHMDENPQSNPDCALANLFTDPGEMGRMRLFLRYQNSVQREYDTAVRELHKAKEERLREEYERAALGIVDPEPERATALANQVGFASQQDAQSIARVPSHQACPVSPAATLPETSVKKAAAAA